MLNILKKKKEEPEVIMELPEAPSRNLSDYIPYYAHFNAHTLLTKNGEVMQTIRIRCNNQGLNYESGESDAETVREHIRAAILQSVATEDYALWVHTIRRRRKVQYSSKVADPFAAYVNAEWQKTHHWKFQYYNEIYISLLREGQDGKLADKKMLGRVLSLNAHRSFRNRYLDQAATELTAVTDAILSRIRTHYRAERLSIVERPHNNGGAFYSEPMEFLGKLLNLRTEAFPVRECDMSKEIATHTLTFGFNALEAKDAAGHRRFGAMLSLKHYREVTPEAADRLLQSPMECIVSQAFVFTSAKRALKEYQIQKDLFQVSSDQYSFRASGLEEMLTNDHGRPVDFGSLQTTALVIADDYKHIDEEIRKAQAAFGEMGLITVREDIKLEECFWAQLPGNFEFLRRKDVVPTPRIAGFARLNLFPDGKDIGNHWGTAVALMPTQVNSPYFFNFHQQDNGHTVLFDFNAFRDDMGHVIANFLLTSAMKFGTRLFIFDRRHSAYLLFDKLDGAYHRFRTGTGKKSGDVLRLNPFSLEDNQRNRGFLLAWCSTFLSEDVSDNARTSLEAAIDRLYAGAPERRHLSAFIETLAGIDAPLADAFKPFEGAGKYAGLLDGKTDGLNLGPALHAFDLDTLVKKNMPLAPLFAYLMHRIVLRLDGKPTIIVLHEAFDLLDNPFFASRLDSLMEMLTQNNALLLATTQAPQPSIAKSVFPILMANAATRLYVPDGITQNYTSLLPTLTERDSKLMAKMNRQTGDFLITQGEESISLRANLNDMEAAKAIFAGDIKTLIAAGGPYAALPKIPYDEDSA